MYSMKEACALTGMTYVASCQAALCIVLVEGIVFLILSVLNIREKYSLICAAATGDQGVSRTFSRFITLVLKNNREQFLQFICLSFLDLYRKLKHIGVGKLITAVPVDKETEERIRNSAGAILHAQMELETVVDPSIEGGFVFDINDYRLDASIATQLKRVKQQFIDKNRRIV